MAKFTNKNTLDALSINEELGDLPTHYMKSGSSMRPKAQLQELNEFKHLLIPNRYRGRNNRIGSKS